MAYMFSYHQLDASESLNEYITERLEGLTHLLPKKDKEGRWSIGLSKEHKGGDPCHIDVHCHSSYGLIKASAKGETFFIAVDLVVDKISLQLRKGKEKKTTKKAS